MKKRIVWITTSLIVVVAGGLTLLPRHHEAVARGCPPELLRHFLQQDHMVGRPTQVRELVRRLDPGAGSSLTVTKYTPAGEPLRAESWFTVGRRRCYQDTTYSYNGRGWLVGSTVRSKNPMPTRYSYLYLPAQRRIEIEIVRELPRKSSAPMPDAMQPDSIIIRLDHTNRYIDEIDTHGSRVCYRTTFEYDQSGHVCREIWTFPDLRKSRPQTYRWGHVDKYDSRGNVTERRMFDATGRYTSTLSNAYTYDRVGNWLEERSSSSTPGKGKNKGTFRSITTRTIVYRR